jgi:hypothetical protein
VNRRSMNVAVALIPIASACLGFAGVRSLLTRDAVAAPASSAEDDRPARRDALRAAGRSAAVAVSALVEEQRFAQARREAISATLRQQGLGPSRREVLAPVFGDDPTERALLLLASESGSAVERREALASLREHPIVSLGAIESLLARLPDPSLGTGPAHEIMLRIAANAIGLDAAARTDLLTRELNGRPDDPGARPYRPAAALDLLIASEAKEHVESLLRGALEKQSDSVEREELVLRFAAAYPERAVELGAAGAFAAR